MFATYADTSTTQHKAIPTAASLPAQPSKIFPKIGFALSAE